MKQAIRLIPYIFAFIMTACIKANESRTDYNDSFLMTQGVTECDSTLGIYCYRDTLYYYDSTTKMLFKIPEGFESNNNDTYWGAGLRLNNPDSTITIYLDSFKEGWEDLVVDEDNGIYSWWGYCWDNKDVKTAVDESKYGYTKIGFDGNKDFKPIYEKCVMYNDVDSGWRPHLIRIEYPDTLSQEAASIIWEYIKPYPNIFYPNTTVK